MNPLLAEILLLTYPVMPHHYPFMNPLLAAI